MSYDPVKIPPIHDQGVVQMLISELGDIRCAVSQELNTGLITLRHNRSYPKSRQMIWGHLSAAGYYLQDGPEGRIYIFQPKEPDMSMISETQAEEAEKREKDIIAWASACGEVDGICQGIQVVREEAGRLFAHGDDEAAICVRKLIGKLDAKRKELMAAIPTVPAPSPKTD